jgi:hypothetical protein
VVEFLHYAKERTYKECDEKTRRTGKLIKSITIIEVSHMICILVFILYMIYIYTCFSYIYACTHMYVSLTLKKSICFTDLRLAMYDHARMTRTSKTNFYLRTSVFFMCVRAFVNVYVCVCVSAYVMSACVHVYVRIYIHAHTQTWYLIVPQISVFSIHT